MVTSNFNNTQRHTFRNIPNSIHYTEIYCIVPQLIIKKSFVTKSFHIMNKKLHLTHKFEKNHMTIWNAEKLQTPVPEPLFLSTDCTRQAFLYSADKPIMANKQTMPDSGCSISYKYFHVFKGFPRNKKRKACNRDPIRLAKTEYLLSGTL